MEEIEKCKETEITVQCKDTRNEYFRVRREERNFEKDVVKKCKEKPKLFYRFIKGKV